MATAMRNTAMCTLKNNFLFFYLILFAGDGEATLYQFKPNDVESAINSVCLLLVDTNAEEGLLKKFAQLEDIFALEESVFIGKADLGNFVWDGGETLFWKSIDIPLKYQNKDIAFFPKKKIDRTCLYHPNGELDPSAEYFTGPTEITTLVQFINAKCNTFRQPNGLLTVPGMHRQSILENLFQTSEVSNVTMRKIYRSSVNPLHRDVRFVRPPKNKQMEAQCDDVDCETDEESRYKEPNDVKITTCDRISLPLDKDSFFSDYVSRSRPVIISGAATEWPAFDKWTMENLRKLYGNETVHIKLTPGGDFEGVEPITQWENHQEFSIPKMVYDSLKFPDLVVVRPAGVNMKFGEFLDLIMWAADQETKNVSAYLEYSSIPDYMPKLKEDLVEFPFAKFLKLKHLNMWLSDGNTLGRLHFDPFDNLLCQLRGKKQVLLFEPFNNENLYEGHIQQATLRYNRTAGHRFRRSQLEESTSMVMSPVDVLNPDFQRFPRFADVVPLNCTIGEGDVLYMPAFWWHEVTSMPNTAERRNLAVNYWYEPFLNKEFPCQECKLDVNSAYHHLL